MTDEQIWLLLHGSGWIKLWVKRENFDSIFGRLMKDGKLELSEDLKCVRLKEENESIRV
jgi:hypothetical protein